MLVFFVQESLVMWNCDDDEAGKIFIYIIGINCHLHVNIHIGLDICSIVVSSVVIH